MAYLKIETMNFEHYVILCANRFRFFPPVVHRKRRHDLNGTSYDLIRIIIWFFFYKRKSSWNWWYRKIISIVLEWLHWKFSRRFFFLSFMTKLDEPEWPPRPWVCVCHLYSIHQLPFFVLFRHYDDDDDIQKKIKGESGLAGRSTLRDCHGRAPFSILSLPNLRWQRAYIQRMNHERVVVVLFWGHFDSFSRFCCCCWKVVDVAIDAVTSRWTSGSSTSLCVDDNRRHVHMSSISN